MTLTPPQIEVLRKLPADGSGCAIAAIGPTARSLLAQVRKMGLVEGWCSHTSGNYIAALTPSGIEALKEIDNG
jgi:hypothetical protein